MLQEPKRRYHYDLEVVLPVCGKGKYLQRLADFKKYGLLAPGDYKVKVVLLAGANEHIPDLESGWPPEYIIYTLRCPKNQIATKICHYYANYVPTCLDSDVEAARWYARVDDDSVTDVSGLIKNLDKWYEYDAPFYLATSLVHAEVDMSRNWGVEEAAALKTVQQEHIITQRDHEWESCFVSHAAMSKILACQTALDFINERSKIETGPGDRFLGPAAKIAKVYPLNCPFTTKDAHCDNFSYTGGKFNHIHYVARDIQANKYLTFLISLDDKHALDNQFTNNKCDLYNKLVGQDYVFYNNKNLLGIMTFSPVCRITNYNNPNEFLWKVVNDNRFEFIKSDGLISTIFENVTNTDYMVGKFIMGNDTWHYLRRLYPKDA